MCLFFTNRSLFNRYNFALGVKLQYPRHIVLFRQVGHKYLQLWISTKSVAKGDFYEALGHDAVHLVEHAGLNPMRGEYNKVS